MNTIFVAIEGPTGVGKTTLAARLAVAVNAVAVFDPFQAWDRPLIRVDTATFNTFNEQHVHELAAQMRQLPIPLEL